MTRSVDVVEFQLEMYEAILPEAIAELRLIAEPLKGLHVLHVNATPLGGGVSELLRSVIPMERALGIDSRWLVITGDERFFLVTKSIHNALQGGNYTLTEMDKETYIAYNSLNAKALAKDFDIIFVHDPQPAALCKFRPDIKAKWIWRCHIDTSSPEPGVWDFLLPYICAYDASVFTLHEFMPPQLQNLLRVEIIPPGIDPLSPKNIDIPEELARKLLDWTGIPMDGPVICQVSRYDPWKDPLGVIEVYRLIKRERPDVRLVFIGSMALDDPEGWEIYDKVITAKNQDDHIHVFTNFHGMSDIQVNAFQRMSDVIIQKSLKEGFGLVVSEALWKGTPVVANRTGGIPMQLAGGGGYLVDSIQQAAQRILELLSNPTEAIAEGNRGKQYVKDNFLITRFVRDNLKLMQSLISTAMA
ncbi:MAG: glycosyltransferase [Firmicutes bacterium]|nr:glycosyltransferase [Bacillota bacterium]